LAACGAAGGGALATALCCAFACTSAPNLPPTLGDCDSDSARACGDQPSGAGGASNPRDGGVPSDGATLVFTTDSGACGIETALAPTNPACAPCLQQSCCTAASACAIDVNCQLVVETCRGCTSTSSACAATCGFTQQSVPLASAGAFDDLSGCLSFNCDAMCPALNIFQIVVDP
jgi:hypothetical protein